MKVAILNPATAADPFYGTMATLMRIAAEDLDVELEVIECDREEATMRQEARALAIRPSRPDYLVLKSVFAAPHRSSASQTGSLAVRLSGQELLEKAFASRNGHRVRALWNGDRSGYPSASECDLALCSHLWFWCGGDVERVDALFRRSGCMR